MLSFAALCCRTVIAERNTNSGPRAIMGVLGATSPIRLLTIRTSRHTLSSLSDTRGAALAALDGQTIELLQFTNKRPSVMAWKREHAELIIVMCSSE